MKRDHPTQSAAPPGPTHRLIAASAEESVSQAGGEARVCDRAARLSPNPEAADDGAGSTRVCGGLEDAHCMIVFSLFAYRFAGLVRDYIHDRPTHLFH